MSGLSVERRNMVERQLRGHGVTDERVLRVMTEVPRHHYLPGERWLEAYVPRAVQIGHGQTMSQPYMVATMTQLLELTGDEFVLEIGTGSGYQAAVLAHLAAGVVSVERIPELALAAGRALREAGHDNVAVLAADGSTAIPMRANFDRILVTAGAPEIPAGLLEHLADPGRLICPVGDRDLQELWILEREGGVDRLHKSTPCRFVPLVGRGGWNGG